MRLKVTYRLSAALPAEGQPDSKFEQTMLLGYSQNVGVTKKNAKNFNFSSFAFELVAFNLFDPLSKT